MSPRPTARSSSSAAEIGASALPRFGGQRWTFISAVLLLIPAGLLAFVVPSGWLADQSHATQMAILLGCAAGALRSSARVGSSTERPPTPESKNSRGAAASIRCHCEKHSFEAIQPMRLWIAPLHSQ